MLASVILGRRHPLTVPLLRADYAADDARGARALALLEAGLDGSPIVVGMNCDLLDTIHTKLPALAGEVDELRKAATAALTPAEEPEPEPQRDEFGLPPATDAEGLPY